MYLFLVAIGLIKLGDTPPSALRLRLINVVTLLSVLHYPTLCVLLGYLAIVVYGNGSLSRGTRGVKPI